VTLVVSESEKEKERGRYPAPFFWGSYQFIDFINFFRRRTITGAPWFQEVRYPDSYRNSHPGQAIT